MERRSSEVQSTQCISANQLFFPSQLQRDKRKQLCCKQQQITLVTVNPQWNGTWSQLRATIRNSRPGTTLKVCLLLTFFLQRSGNNSCFKKVQQLRILITIDDVIQSSSFCDSPFPHNLTLEEVTNAVKETKFFKRIERDSFIAFDYKNSGFPMMEFKKVFKNPNTSPDSNTKRILQIYRYVQKISLKQL